MSLVSGDVVRLAARRTAGVVIGAATAVAELAFLLFAVPWLALPAARRGIFAATRAMAEFERRRIERYFGQANAEDYTARRALRYLAVRWLAGGLGAGVLLLITFGAMAALIMLWQLLSGGSIGDSADPDGPSWYEPIYFVLLGTLLVFVTLQGLLGVARLDGRLARHFLGPTPGDLLRRRVSQLTVSRAEVVEAITDERRRIERDLHDGVQQRLVALGMLLGRAERSGDPDRVGQLLRQARDEAERTLLELRDVAWRVYPIALDSGGLRVALESLAERSGVPVRLRYLLTERYPDAIETAAYFVACEVVTNAIKHAGASAIEVRVSPAGKAIVVRVGDDGCGGADPGGGGLSGLARRVAAVDGVLSVRSPAGGPTVITAELPCG